MSTAIFIPDIVPFTEVEGRLASIHELGSVETAKERS